MPRLTAEYRLWLLKGADRANCPNRNPTSAKTQMPRGSGGLAALTLGLAAYSARSFGGGAQFLGNLLGLFG